MTPISFGGAWSADVSCFVIEPPYSFEVGTKDAIPFLKSVVMKWSPAWFGCSPNASISQSVEQELNHLETLGVSVKNPWLLRRFLQEHLSMIDLTFDLVREAACRFCPKSEITLELFEMKDEHGIDVYPRLLIRQWPYDRDLMNQIQTIYEKFQDRLGFVDGWFQITTDFKRPSSNS